MTAIANKYDIEFGIFLTKFINFFSNILNGTVTINSDIYNEQIAELVIYANEYGIQYGLNHRLRRCNSDFILRTENQINIINLNISFKNLINGLIELQKSIVECKKVFICGSITLKTSITNILHIETWIPGTLTNVQYAIQKYKFGSRFQSSKQIVKNSIPVSVIFSLNPKSYNIIIREVLNILTKEVIYDVNSGRRRQLNISYIGIIDTNINDKQHTNVTNVCLNSYSRYTKKLLSALLNYLFDHIAKKQD
jgi:hypothetical protein